MTYLASQLITESLYLSGICSRDLETPSADQITDGLNLLNSLITLKANDFQLLPFYKRSTFNTVAGQEVYFLTGVYAIEDMTFNIGSVRFSMIQMSRNEYFGSPRQDGLQSLPFSFHVERIENGSNVYLYYVPNTQYLMQYTAKFGYNKVLLDTDLEVAMEDAYINYLKYDLARFICSFRLISLPPQTQTILDEIKNKLIYSSPPDLTMTKQTTFESQGRLTWAQVNIGGPWVGGQ